MFPYTRETKVSGCNHSVSEWYPAYRDTLTNTPFVLQTPYSRWLFHSYMNRYHNSIFDQE